MLFFQPIELRVPQRRIRDLCDALIYGPPPNFNKKSSSDLGYEDSKNDSGTQSLLVLDSLEKFTLSQTVMEEINNEVILQGGAELTSISLTNSSNDNIKIDLIQTEVDEKYNYFPTIITIPNRFWHSNDLLQYYAATFNNVNDDEDTNNSDVSIFTEGDEYEYDSLSETPGSAVFVYKCVTNNNNKNNIRILMHRIPFLVRKLQEKAKN